VRRVITKRKRKFATGLLCFTETISERSDLGLLLLRWRWFVDFCYCYFDFCYCYFDFCCCYFYFCCYYFYFCCCYFYFCYCYVDFVTVLLIFFAVTLICVTASLIFVTKVLLLRWCRDRSPAERRCLCCRFSAARRALRAV